MIRLFTGFLLVALGPQLPSTPDVVFRTVDVQRDWGVVYAVRVADVNADGRLDIVAINPSQLAWFENPGWQRHVIVDGAVPRDHVTIAAHDVDGDGRVEIALGAGWNPRNTSSGGELFLATRSEAGGTRPWTLAPLGSEPTLHRIRWATTDGTRPPHRHAAAWARHRSASMGRRRRARVRARPSRRGHEGLEDRGDRRHAPHPPQLPRRGL